jgi:hypothetical protein
MSALLLIIALIKFFDCKLFFKKFRKIFDRIYKLSFFSSKSTLSEEKFELLVYKTIN